MEITQNEFKRIQVILEKFSGIALSENKHYLVSSRLAPLLKLYQYNSFSELIQHIDKSNITLENKLLEQVIDLMTTNETLWFRDDYPFNFLVNNICNQWQRNQNYRVLSVGCSTGQEPYSIAMSLDRIRKLDNTEIVATDISQTVLHKAKMGIYQKMEIERGLSSENLSLYFNPLNANYWQIIQRIHSKINFRYLNLNNMSYQLGNYDIIFCRNVLIYFSEQNKLTVLKRLVSHLRPEGYLILGGSETIPAKELNMTKIECSSGFAYQKNQ
jgi:chemotaxis protein methyltransferase CheR